MMVLLPPGGFWEVRGGRGQIPSKEQEELLSSLASGRANSRLKPDERDGTSIGLAKFIRGMKVVEVQVALAMAVLVTFFVPGLVWATVIAGLYKLVRERVQESEASGSGQASDL